MMSETKEAAEIQTVGQLLTDPHARREKGEAEHDHEHGHDAAGAHTAAPPPPQSRYLPSLVLFFIDYRPIFLL